MSTRNFWELRSRFNFLSNWSKDLPVVICSKIKKCWRKVPSVIKEAGKVKTTKRTIAYWFKRLGEAKLIFRCTGEIMQKTCGRKSCSVFKKRTQKSCFDFSNSRIGISNANKLFIMENSFLNDQKLLCLNIIEVDALWIWLAWSGKQRKPK